MAGLEKKFTNSSRLCGACNGRDEKRDAYHHIDLATIFPAGISSGFGFQYFGETELLGFVLDDLHGLDAIIFTLDERE